MADNLNAAGIPIPDNIQQDNLQLETPPTTGLLTGSALNAFQGMVGGLTDLRLRSQTFLTNELDPGNHLTNDEWKTSPWFRDGLKIPDTGINENVAKVKADQFDNNQFIQANLDNMPQGVISEGAKDVSSIAGLALNPISLIPGVFASKLLVRFGAAPLLAKLDDLDIATNESKNLLKAAKLSVRFGTGVGEGAAFAAPQVSTNIDTAEQFGQNVDMLQQLANVGKAAIFGGAIRGVVGVKLPISREAHTEALETAINQLGNGKQVNVEPILKAGYEEARNADPILNEEERANKTNQLNDQVNEQQTNVKNEQDRLEGVGKDIPQIPEREGLIDTLSQINNDKLSSIKHSNLIAPEIINNAVKVLRTDPLMRTQQDQSFLMAVPKTDEMQNGITTLFKSPKLRTTEENNLINDLYDNQESKMLRERVNENKSQLDDINNAIDQTDPTKLEQIGKLNAKKLPLELKIKDDTERLENVRTINKIPKNVIRQRLRLAKEQASLNDLNNMKFENDVFNRLSKSSIDPLQQTELDAASTKMRSPEGNTTFNQDEVNSFANELKGIDEGVEEDFEPIQREIESLRAKGELNPEELDLLDQIDKSGSQLSDLREMLGNYINCVLKG